MVIEDVLSDIIERVRTEVTLAPIDGNVEPVFGREVPVDTPLVGSHPWFKRLNLKKIKKLLKSQF